MRIKRNKKRSVSVDKTLFRVPTKTNERKSIRKGPLSAATNFLESFQFQKEGTRVEFRHLSPRGVFVALGGGGL